MDLDLAVPLNEVAERLSRSCCTENKLRASLLVATMQDWMGSRQGCRVATGKVRSLGRHFHNAMWGRFSLGHGPHEVPTLPMLDLSSSGGYFRWAGLAGQGQEQMQRPDIGGRFFLSV